MKPLVSEETILGVYHETLEALYAYVWRRADGDRGIAEDVVQETWLRAVAAWPAQGLPSKPIAWLKTVARNVLLNRRRTPEPVSLDGLPRVDSDQGLGVRDLEPEHQALVRQALAQLPRSRARLLERFHFEGFSVAEIAESDGLSPRAVEGRLRRARQALRREIESLQSEGELT
jgi:RNA polymerase sigma-70 factor, ECF subfamily